MRKKPDGHEYIGAGVEISGLSGELAIAAAPVAPWLSRPVTSVCAAASHVSEVGPCGWGGDQESSCAAPAAARSALVEDLSKGPVQLLYNCPRRLSHGVGCRPRAEFNRYASASGLEFPAQSCSGTR
jgi:hypothetical protein